MHPPFPGDPAVHRGSHGTATKMAYLTRNAERDGTRNHRGIPLGKRGQYWSQINHNFQPKMLLG